MNRCFIIVICVLCFCRLSFSQKKGDTLVVKNDSIRLSKSVDSLKKSPVDSVTRKKFSPRTAALRSAILPGWGQAYNRKYWKIPIVYGALITTGAVFSFNIKQYNAIRYAYKVLINKDTPNFVNVDPGLQQFIRLNASSDLFRAETEVRRNIDYTVLVFLFFWGLNVVDALVDAHLKGFNVTDDLSFKIRPVLNPGYSTPGISVAFDIHKGKSKLMALP